MLPEFRGARFGLTYCDRSDVMSKLLRARVGRFADLVLRGRGNPVLLDPEICLDLFWPSGMPSRFEDLAIKTIVVATNYLDREEVAYDAGPLRPAVAGSMAIPGLFRPVIFRNEVLIDGGAVNPLPYDLLFSLADIIVAVDVTFGGRSPKRRTPSPFASMFGAAQIMQGAITAQKLDCARRISLCDQKSSISLSSTFFVQARSCEPRKIVRRSSKSLLGDE